MLDFRKGDYYRYLAEFKTEQDRKEAAEQSLKGYEACLFYISCISTNIQTMHVHVSFFIFDITSCAFLPSLC